MKTSRRAFVGGASAAALMASSASFAQKKYDDGASDSEIRIGHTCPYSGPASAYGVNGKAIVAFWDMINDTGGINGRASRVAQVRRLPRSEERAPSPRHEEQVSSTRAPSANRTRRRLSSRDDVHGLQEGQMHRCGTWRQQRIESRAGGVDHGARLHAERLP